jgi:hypothetical protein
MEKFKLQNPNFREVLLHSDSLRLVWQTQPRSGEVQGPWRMCPSGQKAGFSACKNGELRFTRIISLGKGKGGINDAQRTRETISRRVKLNQN